MRGVTFIDTSVLVEILEVPGMFDPTKELRAEFELRADEGEHFLLPITAIVETGNHIEHSTGDRRSAAERLAGLLDLAASGTAPLITNSATCDGEFIVRLLAGSTTGRSFVELMANKELGGGDVAILVEREQFVDNSALDLADVPIWTLDTTLGAYSHA